jgi:NAD-dependent DNA ligase
MNNLNNYIIKLDMDKITVIKHYTTKEMSNYCSETGLEELHRLKLYLDDLYYNTDRSEICDRLYDILKDSLMRRDPEYIPPVGAKIRSNENRVKLPYWMGSASKITPDEKKELDRWIDKNLCKNVFVSEKLDGVSGTFVCKNGVCKLYTRGDGLEGADISYLIQYIKTIPKITKDIAVRGELIIKKDIFNLKYKSDGSVSNKRTYKHSRNMVSGLVGAKTIREGLKDLEFVVYEIVGDETMPKPSKQFKKLEKMGFVVAKNKKVEVTNNMDYWVNLHNEFKKDSEYEIDGIIIQSNIEYDRNISGNPEYLFAFKVLSDDMIKETTVKDIEWSVSSWGQIIPVAILDPVDFPGVTISRVTLSNASLMKEKMIGPGALVNVTRSKEVIPFILDVPKPCENLKWPDIPYIWDDNEVHIKVRDASEDIIRQMKVKMFAKFFAKMGIKHVSIQTIEKLYEAGFDNLLKIVRAKESELVLIEGIQKKSASRIVKNIHDGLQHIKACELLGACGVFGFGIGRKRVISLMTDIPDILSAPRKGLKKRILEVEGFSEIMADKVLENIDYAVEFIDSISPYVSFEQEKRVSNTLVGKKFCFSGFRSKDLEQEIEDRGGKTVTSVSKKTSGIIVASKDGKQSSKVLKANSYGIPVYTKEEFIKTIISPP